MTQQNINYDTDQFADPVSGLTVQDNPAEPYYFCPGNGITYLKTYINNGFYPMSNFAGGGGLMYSHQITLTPVSGADLSSDTGEILTDDTGTITLIAE